MDTKRFTIADVMAVLSGRLLSKNWADLERFLLDTEKSGESLPLFMAPPILEQFPQFDSSETRAELDELENVEKQKTNADRVAFIESWLRKQEEKYGKFFEFRRISQWRKTTRESVIAELEMAGITEGDLGDPGWVDKIVSLRKTGKCGSVNFSTVEFLPVISKCLEALATHRT